MPILILSRRNIGNLLQSWSSTMARAPPGGMHVCVPMTKDADAAGGIVRGDGMMLARVSL